MKMIFTLVSIALALNVTSQTNEEIQNWQNNNRGKFLMHSDSYSYLDDELKTKISDRVFFIENLSTSENLTISQNIDRGDEFDAQEIKNWLANHPDVKILKKSEYNSFSSDDQSMYLNSLALILVGEKILIEDIRNYPY